MTVVLEIQSEVVFLPLCAFGDLTVEMFEAIWLEISISEKDLKWEYVISVLNIFLDQLGILLKHFLQLPH